MTKLLRMELSGGLYHVTFRSKLFMLVMRVLLDDKTWPLFSYFPLGDEITA